MDLCSTFLPLGAPKCAKSVVLPPDFMTTGGAAPLVATAGLPAGAASSSSAPTKTSWVPLAVGAVLIGGVLYLVAKGAAPVLANPGLPDGVAKRKGFTARDADPRELARGTKHEMEHTSSRSIARQIALDHLAEDPHYYRKLARIEP